LFCHNTVQFRGNAYERESRTISDVEKKQAAFIAVLGGIVILGIKLLASIDPDNS
jgi:hypothetical protein